MICYFCQEQERESYWKHYCKDCAMLRRMLVLHKPKECVAILKRCLIRNSDQIDHKIKKEVSFKAIEAPKEEVKIVTRSKKNLTN